MAGEEDETHVKGSAKWWDETCRMAHEGYAYFYRKRGRKPPPVSESILQVPPEFYRSNSDPTDDG